MAADDCPDRSVIQDMTEVWTTAVNMLEVKISFLTFMSPCMATIFYYMSNTMQRYTVYFIWKLLYMFRVEVPPIIRSAYNCIYSTVTPLYCYLPL